MIEKILQIQINSFKNKRYSFCGFLSKVLTVYFLTFCLNPAHAKQSNSTSRIFTDKNTYQFSLQAPFAEMAQFKKDNGINFLANKNKKFPAILSYKNSDQQKISFNIQISLRGFTSLQTCDFPKLEIKFLDSTAHTLFEDIKKIDLNTHCGEWKNKQNSSPGDEFMYASLNKPFREVPIYRFMEKLGLPTLKVHPIYIEYIDTATQQRPESAQNEKYQAFFIEDKTSFMKRLNLSEIKGVNDSSKQIDLDSKKTSPEQYQFLSVQTNAAKIDLKQIAQIELLQFLISNNDWYIKKSDNELRIPDLKEYLDELWNINIFAKSSQEWVFLAHDYNLSYISAVEMEDKFSFTIPFKNKFLSMLDETSKALVLNNFIKQKSLFLEELQLLKEDPYYTKIIEHIEEKFIEIEKF